MGADPTCAEAGASLHIPAAVSLGAGTSLHILTAGSFRGFEHVASGAEAPLHIPAVVSVGAGTSLHSLAAGSLGGSDRVGAGTEASMHTLVPGSPDMTEHMGAAACASPRNLVDGSWPRHRESTGAKPRRSASYPDFSGPRESPTLTRSFIVCSSATRSSHAGQAASPVC